MRAETCGILLAARPAESPSAWNVNTAVDEVTLQNLKQGNTMFTLKRSFHRPIVQGQVCA